MHCRCRNLARKELSGVHRRRIPKGELIGVVQSMQFLTSISWKVMDVNVNGVLYTAQAAGRHMGKFGSPGSIILIASISGNGANKVHCSSDEYTCMRSLTNCTGSSLGRIQYKQISCSSNGTKHGMRTWSKRYQS